MDNPTILLDSFKKVSEEKNFSPGEYLFREGEEDDRFYWLVSGEIAISIKTSDGNERIIAFIQEGEFIGEGVLHGKTHKPASARAVTPSKVFILSRSRFLEWIKGEPASAVDFLLRVLSLVNDRLSQNNVKMKALFEINQTLHLFRGNLKGLCTGMVQQLIALVESHDGAVFIKNPYSGKLDTAYSTSETLNAGGIKDISRAESKTLTEGHLLLVPLKRFGAVALRRPVTAEAYTMEQLHLVQIIADQAAASLEEAGREEEEKAKTQLRQQKIVL